MEERQESIIAAEHAGFWIRLYAYVIDIIVLWIIILMIYLLTTISGADIYSVLYNTIFGIVGFIIGIAYFVCFWAWRGQTPGKMAFGIKVIRTDGSDIGWGHSFLRCAGYILSAAIICIGYLWIAFDSRKQGIHDKIADSFVIKLPSG